MTIKPFFLFRQAFSFFFSLRHLSTSTFFCSAKSTISSELSQIYTSEPNPLMTIIYPRLSSCSFSCRQTPVRLAAIRFPGRYLTGQAALRPPQPQPPPPSAAPPTRTGSWRAAGRSWTQRWGCTALLTPLRPQPARTTPTTSPTAPTHPLSTPLWWASQARKSGLRGGGLRELRWSIRRLINLSHTANN